MGRQGGLVCVFVIVLSLFNTSIASRSHSQVCSKKYSTTEGLESKTGGVFSFFCLHGFSYGSMIIKKAEGDLYEVACHTGLTLSLWGVFVHFF